MRTILFTLLVFNIGCVAADVMRLDPTPRAMTSPDSVLLFLEEPDRPYTAIALIEVTDQGWGKSLEDLRSRMSKEAAKLGGEAVILGRESEEAGVAFIPIGNTLYAANVNEKRLIGKVIVFGQQEKP